MALPKIARKIAHPSFIDILISLASLGFLVVLLLAVINPLEKIRRVDDEKTYLSGQKLAQALKSFQSREGKLPWKETSSRPEQTWLKVLVDGGYLEADLATFTNLKEYLVVNTAPQKICFYPLSEEFRKQGNLDESGVNECLPEGFTPCYICFEF